METVEPRVAEAQQLVLELWRRLLGRPDHALDDNFFACGGRSIHMKATLDAIRERFGARLELEVFIDHPTARALGHQVLSQDSFTL